MDTSDNRTQISWSSCPHVHLSFLTPSLSQLWRVYLEHIPVAWRALKLHNFQCLSFPSLPSQSQVTPAHQSLNFLVLLTILFLCLTALQGIPSADYRLPKLSGCLMLPGLNLWYQMSVHSIWCAALNSQPIGIRLLEPKPCVRTWIQLDYFFASLPANNLVCLAGSAHLMTSRVCCC